MKTKSRILMVLMTLAVCFSLVSQVHGQEVPKTKVSFCCDQNIDVEIHLTWYDPQLCYKDPENCSPPWYRLGTGMNLLEDCGTERNPENCFGKIVACPVILTKDLETDSRGYESYFTELSIPSISSDRMFCADSGGAIKFLREKKDGTVRIRVDLLWDSLSWGSPSWNRDIVTGTIHLDERHMDDEVLMKALNLSWCMDRELAKLPR